MAFEVIGSSLIQVGKAITAGLWSKVKNSFDDHESRINNLETNATKVSVFDIDLSNASLFSTAEGLLYFEADTSFTITNAFIRIFEVGSLAGEVEIDVKRSTTDLDDASFTSIFTTRPLVDFDTASDYDASTNQVFDNGQISISTGDFLRLDITSTPSNGVIPKLLIKVYGE